jgi:hypothetical protein
MSVQNPEKWGIENEKWQIQVAGFTPSSWDIIFLSQGFQPVDMLVFIAVMLPV